MFLLNGKLGKLRSTSSSVDMFIYILSQRLGLFTTGKNVSNMYQRLPLGWFFNF